MNVTAKMLLDKLPPFKDDWIKIKDRQVVDDIIERILVAHKKYAPFYDKIALYFDSDTIEGICDNLKKFLTREIEYTQEPDKIQTTSLPTGILHRGFGDCKHYASFCGGVLDALNRLTKKKIDWCYRFVSYKPFSKKAEHVFVVVNMGSDDIWLDPVPGADKVTPTWLKDVYVNATPMPLYENIAGVPDSGIGTASITVSPKMDGDNNLNFDGSNKYKGVFDPYLGLSMYRDYGGERIIGNMGQLITQLNNLIASGPQPGHSVTADFINWVYNTSLRSWNFYYANGVKPGFSAATYLPSNYPRLLITPDGRLNFDRDQKIDDYRNAEIHLLTAWAQSLVNDNSQQPYPVKPEALKNFSQGKEGNPDTRNLLHEARGDSFLHDLGKFLQDAVNLVKDGVLKIAGSIPRNAYLSLVGLNIFHWATKLEQHIANGEWPEIASKWKKFGGNPDKLLNTIEHGAKQPAVDEHGEAIGVAPVAAAWIAAATPLIAIFIKYMDKDGKAGEIVNAAIPLLSQQFPDIDFSGLVQGLTPINKKNGQPIEWYIDPKDDENKGGGNNALPGQPDILGFAKNNPEIIAAGAGVVAYFIMNRRKGVKKNILVPVLVGGGIYFLLKHFGSSASPASTTTTSTTIPSNSTAQTQRAALLTWITGDTSDTPATIAHVKSVFTSMPDDEIATVYNYIFNYALKNIPVPEYSPLYTSIMQISSKYQIFT